MSTKEKSKSTKEKSGFFAFIKDLYSSPEDGDLYPKVNVTWSGSAYVNPKDILESENAKKQIRHLKKLEFVKEIKEKRETREKEKA